MYKQMLKSSGALSNLFSDNNSPYIVSRNVENAYCEAFGAENLGRSDCSADASLDGVGVGLKTFIHQNGKTLQKIAEFNKDSALYRNKQAKELIYTLSDLRNKRIDFTMRTYGLNSMIYHCVTRLPGKILIFELPMDKIDIQNIRNIIVSNKNTITFEDGKNEYSFNITKSTLYMRFNTVTPLAEIEVTILEKPYLILANLLNKLEPLKQQEKVTQVNLFDFIKDNVPASDYLAGSSSKLSRSLDKIIADPPYYRKHKNYNTENFVILPLFSDRGNKRHVPEKSGLNQWNASGRTRHPDEVYIPIPKWIHDVFPLFFPARDESFQLRLPDKSLLSAKVCQDNSKALMSNPNRDLGKWILRRVLDLKEKDPLTYKKLQELGIDSVRVSKHSERHFSIDFCDSGTYDEFESNNR